MAMTHDELCQIACRFLQNNGFKVAFHDRFRAWTPYGEQADAIGFRNGASCLIEAKCSRSDLLADRKKPFRVEPEKGMGDWRFMISEPGIVNIEDLQHGWGLLHVVKGRVKKVHGWPGNWEWVNRDSKPFQANKQAECDYMFSALRRMDLRGHLKEVYDGVIVNRAADNQLNRERLEKIKSWRETYGAGSNVMLPAEEVEELARIALAVMDGEPVAEVLSNRPGNDTSTIDRALPVGTQLYLHAQPEPVVPDGYVMVPVEPTKEMIDAGWLHYMATKNPSSKGTYKAMLAAAPREEI